jgi:hypothetical protein
MKVTVFAAALLACAVPAFAQVETTPGTCEAALFSPDVPRAIVVVTVPAPAFPLGGGAARSLGAPAHSATFRQPSPLASGIASGIGTVSGIGGMERSGIGGATMSGIGSIGTAGVGTMTASGIGSIGAFSLGLPPSPVSSPLAVALPLPLSPALGSSSMRANAITPPRQATLRSVPFICP